MEINSVYGVWFTPIKIRLLSLIVWLPDILSPTLKWLGHEADWSHPSSVDVKKTGAMPPLPHVFMILKHQGHYLLSVVIPCTF